jgi:hypothetical protein
VNLIKHSKMHVMDSVLNKEQQNLSVIYGRYTTKITTSKYQQKENKSLTSFLTVFDSREVVDLKSTYH